MISALLGSVRGKLGRINSAKGGDVEAWVDFAQEDPFAIHVVLAERPDPECDPIGASCWDVRVWRGAEGVRELCRVRPGRGNHSKLCSASRRKVGSRSPVSHVGNMRTPDDRSLGFHVLRVDFVWEFDELGPQVLGLCGLRVPLARSPNMVLWGPKPGWRM